MRKAIAAILLATALCGCNQGAGPESVDDEALDTIALAVEDEMNEPAVALLSLLHASAQEAQVGWDTLFINLDGEPVPVNWWMQRRGFLEMSGAQFATRAAFTLTKPAQDILAQPDQPWFEAQVTGEPAIDCRTPAAVAANGCEVELEITPGLTPAGRAAIGQATLQPFAATAVVTIGAEGWEVTGLNTEGAAPRDIGLTAILGTAEQREEAQRLADSQMKGRLSQLAGESEPVINLEAYTPPNYIEPETPVRPVEPQRPAGRPDSPFRPGN